MRELLPLRASFGPGDGVEVELRGFEEPTRVRLWHLDELIAEAEGMEVVGFGPLACGGYGVEADDVHTAVEVAGDRSRLRYGFVADFGSGRDPRPIVDNARRLHLNSLMFYDWMYRHEALLPQSEEFADALGRTVSLATVRTFVASCREAGIAPLGYAAVYAVGRAARETWHDEGLFHASGKQWQLGDDFLWLVDPSSERWLDHLTRELRAALDVGFAGFHLDQFGWPKRAVRKDGTVVDLAEALPKLIDRVRTALPDAHLVFNNVNDFPTASTASAPQDAVYIEVWPPHDSLGDLARLVDDARRLAPGKPVTLAAYPSRYPEDRGGLDAIRFHLATVFSRGATPLMHGEERALLVDPYYVRNHELDASGYETTRAYYDFAVRYADLLLDERAVDVTRTHWGGINEEIRVEAGAPVTADPTPGAYWVRVVSTTHGYVLHLIDLSAQHDVVWNGPKRPVQPKEGIRVAVERVGGAPAAFAASPETSPALRRLDPQFDGRHDAVVVPAFKHWALVWIRAPHVA